MSSETKVGVKIGGREVSGNDGDCAMGGEGVVTFCRERSALLLSKVFRCFQSTSTPTKGITPLHFTNYHTDSARRLLTDSFLCDCVLCGQQMAVEVLFRTL